jgi:hypothetical protein
MRIENEIELKMHRRNYDTIVYAIFRWGRIERPVKNEILLPLEFSDLEQFRECIKEKYTKFKRILNKAYEFYKLSTQTSVVLFL